MPDVPGNDPDVLALQRYARKLDARGLTDERILNTVRRALAPAGLTLPRTFVATHETSGLPDFPAVDLFDAPSTPVVVGFDCELVWPHFKPWNSRLAVGGWTCYLKANARLWYYVTHFGQMNPRGQYREGDVLGTVGRVPGDPPWWPAHIHHARHAGSFVPAQL